MTLRSILPLAAVLLLIGPALAGCVGSSGGGAPSTSGDGVDARTDPDDPDGPASTNATGNVSPEATDWVRERWSEGDEVVLVDDSGTVTTGASTWSPQTCFFFCSGASFQPAEGTFVAPGTATVNVTASWQTPPTAPGVQVELFYQTAAGGDPQGRVVPNGEPVTLNVSATDRDAPMQQRSLWWFYLFAFADPAGSIVQMEVQLQAVAERGPTLPTIPPAPDPWQGGDEIVVVDGATQEAGAWTDTPALSTCLVGPCVSPWEATNGSVVPADASAVEATVSWSGPLPSRPVLYAVHPAGEVAMELVEDGDGARTFRTPVPAEAADSPHQSRSLWAFYPGFETQDQDAGAFTGSLTLDASAVRGNATG